MKHSIFTPLFLALLMSATMAQAAVTIDKASDNYFDLSKGTNYYPIYLCNATMTAKAFDTSHFIVDLREEVGTGLYCWSGSFTATQVTTGVNSLGVDAGGFMRAVVSGAKNWSGMGYAVNSAKDLSGITSDYHLHFAVRSTSTVPIYFYLSDGVEGGKLANFVLGSTAFEDETSIAPVGDFARDGNWYNVDIPVSDIIADGISFASATAFTGNLFCLKAGNVVGTTVDYDAVFFYKPSTTTGIASVKATDAMQITSDGGNLEVTSPVAGITVYNVQGQVVAASKTATLSAESLQAGVYMVSCNGAVRKVIVK